MFVGPAVVGWLGGWRIGIGGRKALRGGGGGKENVNERPRKEECRWIEMKKGCCISSLSRSRAFSSAIGIKLLQFCVFKPVNVRGFSLCVAFVLSCNV